MSKHPDKRGGGTDGKARSIHDAGSPDSRHGPRTGTNPDGATPAELPSTSASLHRPARPQLPPTTPRKTP